MTTKTATRLMRKDSNGGRALAVTFALAVALGACAPAAVTASPSPSGAGIATPTAGAGSTKTPTPTLAAGMTRFTGKIIDASNGYALSGVCVIIGPPSECLENMPHSNEHGVWLVDLPVAAGGLSWTFTFVKDGYALATVKGLSDAPGEKTVDVSLEPK